MENETAQERLRQAEWRIVQMNETVCGLMQDLQGVRRAQVALQTIQQGEHSANIAAVAKISGDLERLYGILVELKEEVDARKSTSGLVYPVHLCRE